MTVIPHFEYPFRLGADGHAAVVEQDTEEDVISCITVILKTPSGARLDLPGFGFPEQLFRESGINPNALLAAIRDWEPRGEFTMTISELVNMAQSATVNVNARSDA